ncbi:MAG: OmpH family outer membrane protein [Alphaproteobacteria bacterium]
MKKFSALIAIMFSLMISGSLAAQAALPVPQIIVVDYQQVIQASAAAVSLQEQLDVVNDANEAALEPQAASVRLADEKLQASKGTLSDAQFTAGTAEVNRLLTDYQKEVRRRKTELEGRMNRTMVDVRKRLQQITIEIAGERGANMVLAKDAVIIMASEFDVTREALTRLNKVVPTVVLAD